MKTTIIYAHPWEGSFNKAVLDQATQALEKKNKDYQIINLNEDGFNPVLKKESLALFSQGKSSDDLVYTYQNMLKESDEVVFIFPIWWFDLPAILKGFIDKVMLKDFAYLETPEGLDGLLTHITKTTVLTTSEYPTEYLVPSMENLFIKMTLASCGFHDVVWMNRDQITSCSHQDRVDYLESVAQRFNA